MLIDGCWLLVIWKISQGTWTRFLQTEPVGILPVISTRDRAPVQMCPPGTGNLVLQICSQKALIPQPIYVDLLVNIVSN